MSLCPSISNVLSMLETIKFFKRAINLHDNTKKLSTACDIAIEFSRAPTDDEISVLYDASKDEAQHFIHSVKRVYGKINLNICNSGGLAKAKYENEIAFLKTVIVSGTVIDDSPHANPDFTVANCVSNAKILYAKCATKTYYDLDELDMQNACEALQPLFQDKTVQKALTGEANQL